MLVSVNIVVKLVIFIVVFFNSTAQESFNLYKRKHKMKEIMYSPQQLKDRVQYLKSKSRSYEPNFDLSVNRNVTTSVASTAFLKCRVRNYRANQVTWVRQRDLHILTVGTYTYTSDQRFETIHSGEDWTLQIRYPNKTDEGKYECQINTVPTKSLEIMLNVVDLKAKIIGEPTIYIRSGSVIELICMIQNDPTSRSSKFAFWYHDGEGINFESGRGVVTLDTNSKKFWRSILTISDSRPSDSGNYTCKPSNAEKATTIVHITNVEENPAAMQENRVESNSDRVYRDRQFIITSILVLLELSYYSSMCSR